MDSPYVMPGRRVEVDGVELAEEERSMKGWCHVRKKSGQEEKGVATVARGWEEFQQFKQKYPYVAHHRRSRQCEKVVKEKMKSEDELVEMDRGKRKMWTEAQRCEVEKWLTREGGEEWSEGEESKFYLLR